MNWNYYSVDAERNHSLEKGFIELNIQIDHTLGMAILDRNSPYFLELSKDSFQIHIEKDLGIKVFLID